MKSRTYKTGSAFVEYNDYDQFDWLAIMLLQPDDSTNRAIYVISRSHADLVARKDKPTSKTAHLRYFRIDEVGHLFRAFINNFGLVLDVGRTDRSSGAC